MGKTIAITPSWYWPAGVPRVLGVPRFHLHEMVVRPWTRRRSDEVALIDAHDRLTGAELAVRVEAAAGGIAERIPPGGALAFSAGPTVEGAVLFLAALRAGAVVTAVDPNGGPPMPLDVSFGVGDGRGVAYLDGLGVTASRLAELAGEAPECAAGLRDPAVATQAGHRLAWHSHRSLLGGGLSLGTFYGVQPGRPWLSTFPVSTWEGLYGLLTPLLAGGGVAFADSGPASLEIVGREGVGVAFTDLGSACALTRDAKREVKGIRGVLTQLVVTTSGLFDADERRRVGRSFDCPALTLYGRPETGPIFASHPSWYIDESVGIPVTNMHVVPVDARSRFPIQTLWELVESALVTVWAPSLMVGAGDGGERFDTGVVASSDANGMIYVLPN